jgi:hypothetical protein
MKDLLLHIRWILASPDSTVSLMGNSLQEQASISSLAAPNYSRKGTTLITASGACSVTVEAQIRKYSDIRPVIMRSDHIKIYGSTFGSEGCEFY